MQQFRWRINKTTKHCDWNCGNCVRVYVCDWLANKFWHFTQHPRGRWPMFVHPIRTPSPPITDFHAESHSHSHCQSRLPSPVCWALIKTAVKCTKALSKQQPRRQSQGVMSRGFYKVGFGRGFFFLRGVRKNENRVWNGVYVLDNCAHMQTW